MTNKTKEHRVSLFNGKNTAVYFNSFCGWINSTRSIKQNQRQNQIKAKSNSDQIKSITHNTFRMQSMWILLYHFHRIYDCGQTFIRLSKEWQDNI